MNYFSNISSWLKVSAFLFFFLEMTKKLIKSEWMFYHLIFIFFIHINIHSFWYWIPDRDTGNLCNQVCLQFDIGIFPLKKKLEGLKRKICFLGSKSSLQKCRYISLLLPRVASALVEVGQSLSQLCKLGITAHPYFLVAVVEHICESVRQCFGKGSCTGISLMAWQSLHPPQERARSHLVRLTGYHWNVPTTALANLL